jgi:hypothetical protein
VDAGAPADLGLGCRQGLHACAAGCKLDDDPGACGPTCTACPTVADGYPICRDGKCDFACRAGRRCPTQCVTEPESATSCGDACVTCPESANQRATCTAGVCATACRLACNNAAAVCVQTEFGFESGSDEGWRGAGSRLSQQQAHGGQSSVAVTVSPGTNVSQELFVERQLCSGRVDLEGKHLTAWVFIDGPALAADQGDRGQTHCNFSWDDDNGTTYTGVSDDQLAQLQQRRWVPVAWQFRQPAHATTLRVRCFLLPAVGDVWTGTVYFDDIRFD